MRTVTTADLIANCRKAARANPTHVGKQHDGQCYYFHDDGSPSCIVGHALHMAGLSISPEDSWNGHMCNDDLLDYVHVDHPSYQDMVWLEVVQAYQDKGVTWAEAVRLADKELR